MARFASPAGRALAAVIIIGGLGYAGYAFFRQFRTKSTSDTDQVTLVCQKCKAESTMSSAEFAQLPMKAETSTWACPKCGAYEAKTTPYRCPSCGRAFLPPPMGAKMECPLCKAPF